MTMAGHMGVARAWAAAATLLFCVFLCPSLRAQSAPAADAILPSSFGAWTMSGGATQAASQQDVAKFAKDNAAVIREYGVGSAEQASYTRQRQTLVLTLYQMTDPSAAFGAFTFLRDPQMTPLDAGPSASYSAAAKERVLLVVGNLLVEIVSPSGRPADGELKQLAAGLSPHASRSAFPVIANFLPRAGLVHGSERYVLGVQALARAFPVGAASQKDWLGFAKSAEAAIASYHGDGGSGAQQSLLLALYPTQQVAAEQFKSFDKSIFVNAGGNAGSTAAGEARSAIFGKRSGAVIALVVGADSRKAANALLDQVNYSSQVTWNAPTHELTDPNIGTIVVGAIMGTGTIMLLAIVAGIGFGGFRLFMKFLFPGKVFDRSDQVEILQLGLSSKPIRAEDFYMLDTSKKP